MLKVAKTDKAIERLLEGWGIKHVAGMSISFNFEPQSYCRVTVSKILDTPEAEALIETLGDYHLTARDQLACNFDSGLIKDLRSVYPYKSEKTDAELAAIALRELIGSREFARRGQGGDGT
jgi:hypothetical protein